METSEHQAGRDHLVVSLGRDLEAPATARQLLTQHLQTVARPIVDDALVLVSELVTNAVRYGREVVELSVVVAAHVVRVEVRDDSNVLPQPAASPPGLDEPGGRGLLIVNAIATTWGVTPHLDTPGKTVWFELAVA